VNDATTQPSSLRITVKGSPLIRSKSPEPSSLLKAQFQAEELTQGLQVMRLWRRESLHLRQKQRMYRLSV
jgi:hypothetical protein